jgi:hypothetical protein
MRKGDGIEDGKALSVATIGIADFLLSSLSAFKQEAVLILRFNGAPSLRNLDLD